MDASRLRELAGIRETPEDDEAALQRERKIEALIRKAFDQLALPISTDIHAVMYEDRTREAQVTLKETPSGISLAKLSKLFDSGLAQDYAVGCDSMGQLTLTFTVHGDLDYAV